MLHLYDICIEFHSIFIFKAISFRNLSVKQHGENGTETKGTLIIDKLESKRNEQQKHELSGRNVKFQPVKICKTMD